MTTPSSTFLPVIAGAAEVMERWTEPRAAREPLALMEDAVRRTDVGNLLARMDSLDVVNVASWRYERPADQLAERLGVRPPRANYGPVGGESPVRFIDAAAQRIAGGESEVAIICGAEAQYSVAKARSTGTRLPWTPLAPKVDDSAWWRSYLNPIAVTNGVTLPAHVYPFFEHASVAACSQTPMQGVVESGELWSRLSVIAAQRPQAWSQTSFSATEIIEPSPDNRLVAWPYTKRMVANPAVNQGAAVLLTSLARARAAGVPDSRLIFVWAGAAANEPRDYLTRTDYAHCPAQEAVLETMVERVDGEPFDFYEIYSCFPIVPKLARRTLGLATDTALSVTGGLSFFGAPLNNYMTHAAVAMTEALRGKPAATGLLYGQGEFMTKHHAVILSSRSPTPRQLNANRDVQVRAEARRSPPPSLARDYEGAARVETLTVICDRAGEPDFGAVIALTPAGERLMARTAPGDRDTIRRLCDRKRSPIGESGRVKRDRDGDLVWSFDRQGDT